ncbi:MAG: hypothetical protein Q9195_002652 [Heterodermia aff. obscurata]
MRQLLSSLRTSELDPQAGKARPDQLIVQDDPAFFPELALPGLDIDLSALDISTDESSCRSSLLAPLSQHSSVSSTRKSDESMPGIIIPSSGTGGGGSIGGFVLPGEERSSAQRASRMRSILGEEAEGFDLDPGFTFDEQGDIVFNDAGVPVQVDPATRPRPVRLGSDSAMSARVREEIEEGMQAGQFDLGDRMNLDLDIDLPRLDDDQGILPEGEAFPITAPQAPAETSFLRSSSEAPQESSESAEAPARRRVAAPKYLPMDQVASLRNNDLASWNNNYLVNMAGAAQAKQQHKAAALAKRNAAFFVYGTGIGGVGQGLGGSKLPSPLDMFAGDRLMTALTGLEPAPTGRKRSRAEEEEHESDSEGRRVRVREDDGDEVGRGDNLALGEGDTMDMGIGIPGDDVSLHPDREHPTTAKPPSPQDIELGRHAVPTLEDYSSQMPWNTTASALGSRAGSIARGPIGGSIGGFASSAGGSAGPPVPGSHDRRSRLTSASPLHGRGRERLSSLDLPAPEAEVDPLLDDFQLYDPVAGVSTQTALGSQWMRATLDAESKNFLEFIRSELAIRPPVAEGEGAEEEGIGASGDILFEEMLPPGRHPKLVAAQALLHVLALATKGLITVSQRVDYGPIRLGIGEGV